MSQPRVLLVTPSYDPIVGGTETYVRRLAHKLNKIGVLADVMTFHMVQKWKPLRGDIVETQSFRVFKIHGTALPSIPNPINPLFYIFPIHFILTSSFALSFDDYDILHFFDEVDLSFPFFSLCKNKLKIMQCLNPNALQHIGHNFFHRQIFKRIAQIYITSYPSQIGSLVNMGIPKSNVIFMRTGGVDQEIFIPDETKRDNNLVLFVGRLERQKGVHLFLQALVHLKVPIEVAIVGPFSRNDTNYFDEVRKIAASINRKGLHKVKFLGSLGERELLPWYQRAAILVRPDLDELSCGLSSLEALSCATPIVGTGQDIVEDRVNGILVKPRKEELATGIRTLIENKSLRRECGKRGRRLIEEHFSIDSNAERLTSLYEELLIFKAKPN